MLFPIRWESVCLLDFQIDVCYARFVGDDPGRKDGTVYPKLNDLIAELERIRDENDAGGWWVEDKNGNMIEPASIEVDVVEGVVVILA